MLIWDAALLAAVLVLRAASTNPHVRGRLLWSSIAFAASAAVAGADRYFDLSPALHLQFGLVQPLLVVFGAVNAGVALAINPWRQDRLPDRFPTIVQDSIVIALFAVGAVLILQDRILATTAVGAVAVGFALQDTLGNLFAGLAIQSEKPFRVGQWVQLAGKDGLVREITWRATKIRTKAGNFVIVPNSTLARDTITNYSEPTRDTRIEFDVSASYDTPPNEVKAVIHDAIKDDPLLSPGQPIDILVAAFADSAITYRIRLWMEDFGADVYLQDRARSAIYYAFRRRSIAIPYPIRVLMRGHAAQGSHASSIENPLSGVEILSALSEAECTALAAASRCNLHAAGERIVKQGDAGSSMFVVVTGEAVVLLEPAGREVARIVPGGFFGEMSLLTGEPRSATVKTAVDSILMEITIDVFRQFVLANPAVVEEIGAAVALRTQELQEHAAAMPAAPEPPQTLLARMRKFLHLT